MKSERRHELQRNSLADVLEHGVKDVQKYAPAVAATIGAIVVLVVVYLIISTRSANAERSAWREYVVASESRLGAQENMTRVADDYSDYMGGQWARLTLADRQLEVGVDQLFQDRTAAKTSLESAIEQYNQLRATTHISEMQSRALIGLGRAYESLAQPEEAVKQYDELIKNYPGTEFAIEARERRDDLEKPASKEFYQWFWALKITPPSREPGTPGFRPPFDMQSLPSDAPGGPTSVAPPAPPTGVIPPVTTTPPATSTPPATTAPVTPPATTPE
ncbi:MAG: tetratricopeptide repeat protein [Planctomycetes bacterium]|nr:tetratricopeptide repeat protein [Planctomycetota bacterium]